MPWMVLVMGKINSPSHSFIIHIIIRKMVNKERLKEIIQEVNTASGDWRSKIALQPHAWEDMLGRDGEPFKIKNLKASDLSDASMEVLLNRHPAFASITEEEVDRLEDRFDNDFEHEDYPPRRSGRIKDHTPDQAKRLRKRRLALVA